MGNRRKLPKRRGGAKPVPGPGEDYACQFVVVFNRHDQDSVEDAMTWSHDEVIQRLGEHRRSGIWWTQYFSRDGITWLRTLIPNDDPNPAAIAVRDQSIEALGDPSALLVVAWAIHAKAGVPGGAS